MWDLQWDLERSSPLALSSPHPTEFSGGAPAAGINPFRDFKLTPFYKAPPLPSPLPGKGGGGGDWKAKAIPRRQDLTRCCAPTRLPRSAKYLRSCVNLAGNPKSFPSSAKKTHTRHVPHAARKIPSRAHKKRLPCTHPWPRTEMCVYFAPRNRPPAFKKQH